MFGSDATHLSRLYEMEEKVLEPWRDSPEEIAVDDWREYLGKPEYVYRVALFLFLLPLLLLSFLF